MCYLNVKTLFALMHALPHEVGMDEALRTLYLPLAVLWYPVGKWTTRKGWAHSYAGLRQELAPHL
jgi:hypothetical protein